MELADVGGKPVAYHVVGRAGQGTPLLLINGGPGFDHTFLHLSTVWDQLAEARPVIFFDQPGTGQSWPVGADDTLTVAEVLESVEAIREAIGVRSLAVLGHSWGGYVALAYALRHPGRVERVLVIDSVAPRVSATELLWDMLFPEFTAAEGELSADDPADVQAYIRGRLARSIHSPEIRDDVLGRLGAVAYNAAQETLLWEDAEAHDLTDDLARVAVPVLVGTGRFDTNVGPRTAWRIHRAIPGSEFVVWERSGHYPMLEEPTEFLAVVARFLRSR